MGEGSLRPIDLTSPAGDRYGVPGSGHAADRETDRRTRTVSPRPPRTELTACQADAFLTTHARTTTNSRTEHRLRTGAAPTLADEATRRRGAG